MAIETGIYSNIRPMEMPSYLDSQTKASNLTQMGMQNQKMASDMQSDQKNQDYAEQMRKAHTVGSALESMSGMSPQERAATYPKVRGQLVAQGLLSDQDAPSEYDDGFYKQNLMKYRQTKEYLDNQKTKSETAYHYAQAKKQGGAEYDPYKQMQMEKLAMDLEEKKFSKTPEGRLQKLGAEQKQRLDNAKLGLISTRGMSDALKAGDNTFSLVGDNDFTQQRSLFEESLGRMQSGGAISKEEEKRFKEMAPTKWDSAEMQQKKLAQLENEMNSRIGTLGFKPEDVGIAARSSGGNQSSGGSILPSANANSGISIKHGTEEDGFVFMGGDPSDQKNWKKAR